MYRSCLLPWGRSERGSGNDGKIRLVFVMIIQFNLPETFCQAERMKIDFFEKEGSFCRIAAKQEAKGLELYRKADVVPKNGK